MWSLVKAYEELASICRGPLVRHTDNASSVVPQRRSNLVLKRFLPDRYAAFGLRGRGSSLNHEVWYEAVEERAIVVARGAKSKEVLPTGK